MQLPIDVVLPDLLAELRRHTRALLIAPPGAGKTTKVAPALLSEDWCSGQVLLLVPRRLAARAAAEFMASELGEKPAETIGYATRLDTRIGNGTRVIAMTHGVFLSRIQSDPELSGVSAVLFDEVHERSLDNDLALALALDAASALRDDLRLLAMSATLDVERFQRLLNNPPTIVSEGSSFPLDIRYAGRDATARIEPQMASTIRRALAEPAPGNRECGTVESDPDPIPFGRRCGRRRHGRRLQIRVGPPLQARRRSAPFHREVIRHSVGNGAD